MRKLLWIAAALLALTGCYSDDDEDYTGWSTQELLASGEGLKYLISLNSEENVPLLNEWLVEQVLHHTASLDFTLQRGVWEASMVVGVPNTVYVMPGSEKIRCCYKMQDVEGYRTLTASESPIADILRDIDPTATIVAQRNDAIVIEFTDAQNKRHRRVAFFEKSREAVLNRYTTPFE